MHLQKAKGTLHKHAGPSQLGIIKFSGRVEVAGVGLHEPRLQRIGHTADQADGFVHIPDPDGAVGEKSSGMQLMEHATVSKQTCAVRVPQPPDIDVGELSLVIHHSLQDH